MVENKDEKVRLQKTKIEKFVNVDEEDKKEHWSFWNFYLQMIFQKSKNFMMKLKEYQNDESYELNNNVFKDTGKILELEGLTKQEREDEKLERLQCIAVKLKVKINHLLLTL